MRNAVVIRNTTWQNLYEERGGYKKQGLYKERGGYKKQELYEERGGYKK